VFFPVSLYKKKTLYRMATKRERPTDFFNDSEDEDLEYLIEASIENQNDKKNDVVGLDEYINQKSSNEKPCKLPSCIHDYMSF